jgi:hypothetical protein
MTGRQQSMALPRKAAAGSALFGLSVSIVLGGRTAVNSFQQALLHDLIALTPKDWRWAR